jgi:hypothetical protein
MYGTIIKRWCLTGTPLLLDTHHFSFCMQFYGSLPKQCALNLSFHDEIIHRIDRETLVMSSSIISLHLVLR